MKSEEKMQSLLWQEITRDLDVDMTYKTELSKPKTKEQLLCVLGGEQDHAAVKYKVSPTVCTFIGARLIGVFQVEEQKTDNGTAEQE